MGKKGFGSYQASSMGRRKCHLLNHLVDAVRGFEGIEFLYGGLYETAHQ